MTTLTVPAAISGGRACAAARSATGSAAAEPQLPPARLTDSTHRLAATNPTTPVSGEQP